MILKNKNNNPNLKYILILTCVSIFAIHSFYFVYSFAVNTPLGDEWDFVPFILAFNDGENVWESPHFCKQHDEHIQCFPHLLVLLSVITSNYNTIPLLYIGWLGLVISTAFIFFILKNYDEKLILLIIPISAMIFNPIQYGNFLWQIANNGYFLTFLGFTGAVFFLNKLQKNPIYIIPAILFSILASFSSLAGLLVWFVGVFSFYKFQNSRKMLFIWIISMIIVFTLFLSNYSWFGDEKPVSTQLDVLDIIFILYSKGFSNNIPDLEFLDSIIGPLVLILSTLGLSYLFFKNKSYTKILPWMQFSILGLLLTLAYTIGFNLSGSVNSIDSTRYGTLFLFPQISALLVFTEIIRINSKNSKKYLQRYLPKILFVILFSSLFIGLGVSYYVGWWHGFHMYEEHRHVLNCLLEPNSDFLCLEHLYYPHIAWGAEILREIKLGPFGNDVNFNVDTNDAIIQYLRERIVGIPIIMTLEKSEIAENNYFNELDVSLNYNKPLHLVSDKIIFSENLTIEGGQNDIYSVSFWNDDLWIDRVLINTNDSELHQRKIPYYVQENGYDKIVILPILGDGDFKINKISLN